MKVSNKVLCYVIIKNSHFKLDVVENINQTSQALDNSMNVIIILHMSHVNCKKALKVYKNCCKL